MASGIIPIDGNVALGQTIGRRWRLAGGPTGNEWLRFELVVPSRGLLNCTDTFEVRVGDPHWSAFPFYVRLTVLAPVVESQMGEFLEVEGKGYKDIASDGHAYSDDSLDGEMGQGDSGIAHPGHGRYNEDCPRPSPKKCSKVQFGL